MTLPENGKNTSKSNSGQTSKRLISLTCTVKGHPLNLHHKPHLSSISLTLYSPPLSSFRSLQGAIKSKKGFLWLSLSTLVNHPWPTAPTPILATTSLSRLPLSRSPKVFGLPISEAPFSSSIETLAYLGDSSSLC